MSVLDREGFPKPGLKPVCHQLSHSKRSTTEQSCLKSQTGFSQVESATLIVLHVISAIVGTDRYTFLRSVDRNLAILRFQNI